LAAAIGDFWDFPGVELPSEADGSKRVRLFGVEVSVDDSIGIIKKYKSTITTPTTPTTATTQQPDNERSESV